MLGKSVYVVTCGIRNRTSTYQPAFNLRVWGSNLIEGLNFLDLVCGTFLSLLPGVFLSYPGFQSPHCLVDLVVKVPALVSSLRTASLAC